MLFFKYLFMVGVLCFTIIRTLIKDPEKETEDYDPKKLLSLSHFLSLSFFNSSVAWIIFKVDSFLWLAFFSVVCKIILLASDKTKNAWLVKPVVICICLIFVFILRVPKESDSFINYLSSKGTYHCPLRYECVKITTPVNKKDEIHTKAEIIPIDDSSFNWYVLFSKGAIRLKGKEGKIVEIKGTNIAGWWIVTEEKGPS
ncbi:hypothetical protein MXL46_16135 [Heyndrickxia sporothermodurans]|uniref:Uncharacterized protein n=1 Tax=Heyndrickxia sporothermodurans TaxID=46224 RepID=A0A150KLG0_9BACI|nr:hypothetical protein [Heyndrickxia sporothermodurans]KYC92931.1 hypothetical protein B4102_2041 [Heyndrickxia sporothermodurans]MBL5768569.1 hypothetical protein [Heyndrickxia sporothermodurans]MBL5775816.1 hypothetical protein [Heyndrickxia sporothermodurans]MBL5779350.1 hypothetical protein [Heyndrickxia sporothermodurans]MBL5783017.1 hypothetical protein [Heyndrickxia sporothermodurans]